MTLQRKSPFWILAVSLLTVALCLPAGAASVQQLVQAAIRSGLLPMTGACS